MKTLYLLQKNLLRLASIAGIVALLAVSSPPAGRACGFHDDVSMARGALNWGFPDALHVIGAIAAATAKGRLTVHESSATDPFGAHYRALVKALQQFAGLLDAGSGEKPPVSFSLVLVEPMLWTNFEPGPDGVRVQAHVSGPRPDDLVLVSGQSVIRAIANEQLGFGEAYRLGLIRLYGSADKIMQFLRLAAAN